MMTRQINRQQYVLLACGVSVAMTLGVARSALDAAERGFPEPRGLFALSTGTQPLPAGVYAEPSLAGVSLRAGWADVEPDRGRFTWPFDAEITRAVAAGKRVMLRVASDARTPAWVYDAGAQPVDFHDRPSAFHAPNTIARRIPIPWDSVFLDAWTQCIRAMGAQYSDNDVVVLIQMAGPSAYGGEMHLPKSPDDQARWQRMGYSKTKLVGAWMRIIDAYGEAFPRTALALDISTPIWDDGVVEEVIAYASTTLGRRFAVQHNGLHAATQATSPIHRLVASYRGRAIVGFQLLCPVTPRGRFNHDGARFGGSLDEGLRLGLDAGASYIEIYPVDYRTPAAARALRETARRWPEPPGSTTLSR